MTLLRTFVPLAFAGLFFGCAASIPPAELIDARLAYQHAAVGPAAELMPAELSDAREPLAEAEGSFLTDPGSTRTRNLADVAERKARMADVVASSAAGKAVTTMAKSDSQATLDGIKIRELIAGAKRRAAAIAEQNSLPRSKEAGSATKQGGQILTQPKPDAGQRPAGEPPSIIPAQSRQKLDSHKDRPGGMRIARLLLVDDGRNRSDPVRRVLESTDYQVVEADCDSAIDLIGNRMFDLILLGFALPDKSSIRVLASLKQYQLTTRVIMIKEGPGLESEVKSATLAVRGYPSVP